MTRQKKNENKKREYNVFCVLGLIVSLLFGYLGFVLSTIGIFNANKNGEKGKGLAIVGIIVCVIRFVCFDLPNFYSSITPYTVWQTACANVDDNGNYEYVSDGLDEIEDGKIICTNYICEVSYGGIIYSHKCK